MDQLITIWNTTLIKTKGGIIISVGDVLAILGLILASYALTKLVEILLARRLQKTRLRADSILVIQRVSFYVIFVLTALIILSVLGIPVTAFAFATGAIAIGIGFGAQNIINNFISCWILIAERPIRTNDFIEVDGFMGTVMKIRTRSTLIHRLDGVHVLVPNSKLLENTVINWTLLDGLIRNTVRVGVAYGSDIDDVFFNALKAASDAVEEVMTTPAVEFVFEDFGDSALIFDVYFWCDMSQGRPLRLIRSDLRVKIYQELESRNIIVPFPQRDLHLYPEKPMRVVLTRSENEEES